MNSAPAQEGPPAESPPREGAAVGVGFQVSPPATPGLNGALPPRPNGAVFGDSGLPDEEPSTIAAQSLGAVVVAFAPLLLALYAILSAGKGVDTAFKFKLAVGVGGGYGAGLWLIGAFVARRPERAIAGRTLIISSGVIASLVATVTWFSPQNLMGLASTIGAVGLMALAAGLHARLVGRSWRDLGPLLAALLLEGVTGAIVPLVGRPNAIVLDIAATTLACAVFLRPNRQQESAGRIVLALSVPVASLLLKPFWWVSVPQMMGVAMTLAFALPALRPYLRTGTTTLCAVGLLATHLLVAVPSVPSRLLGLVVVVAAMLLLARNVEDDVNAGPLDRQSPAWIAAAAWVILSDTWAQDATSWLRHFVPNEIGASLPVPWLAALTLPLALPPLLFSFWRGKTAPAEVDLEAWPRGTIAALTACAVLVVAQAEALFVISTSGNVAFWVLAGAAAIGTLWSRLGPPNPWRWVVAHVLVLGAAWGFAQAHAPAVFPALAAVGPALTFIAAIVALVLSLTPWMGGHPATGALGFVAFPLLTTEAIYRDGSLGTAAVLLATYGVAQLARPPLSAFPATRLAGPAALVSAAWLALSGADSPRGDHLAHVSHWFGSHPLPLLGGLACVLAVPLLWLAHRQRRLAGVDPAPAPGPDHDPLPVDLDPGFVYEAMAWALLTLNLALALSPLPALPAASAAALVAGAAVAAAWARRVSTPWRRGGSHVLLIAACWVLGHQDAGPIALLAGSACAALLAISPLRSLRGSAQAGWVGLVCLPLATAEAVALGAPPWAAAIPLAAVGVVYVAGAPLDAATGSTWTRGFGLPALLAAGWLLLFNGANPVLAPSALAVAAASALVPLALWVAWKDGPLVYLVQVIAGALAIALLDGSPVAFAPLVVIHLARGPLAIACGSPALLLTAVIVAIYGPGTGVTASAAAFAVAGASLLFRALPPETDHLRLLGFPGLVVAPVVLAFVPHGAGASLLAIEHLPLVAALAVVPFGLWIWRRPFVTFLVSQTLATAAFVALLSIGAAFVSPAGTWHAIEAGVAGLLALATVVAAAQGVGAELRPIAWGFAALGALLALAPTSHDPWHWPVTLVGAVEVILIGRAARRRESPILAAFALWMALVVLAWMAVAFTERIVGDNLMAIVPSLGIAASLAGILVLWRGSRWLGAPPFFLRPFIQTCTIIAAIAATMSLTVVPVAADSAVVQALLSAVAVAALAVPLAFSERAAWPLFLAGGALILPYAYVRTRTPWLDFAGPWDATVAAVAGILIAAAERPWRRLLGAPPIPALPENPAELPFGVAELRLLSAIVLGLSAIAFLDLRGVAAAIGPGLASLAFLWRTRREEDHGPLFGVLSALFCNTTIVLLLLDRGVVSVAAYTLPIFFSIAWLMHVYREHLGHDSSTVRAIPPAVALVLCAYEIINTTASGPTAAVALLGVGMLVSARWFRLRSYVIFGAVALALAVLDAAVGLRITEGSGASNAWRALPITGGVLAFLAAVLIAFGPRIFSAPAEVLRPFVQASIVAAAVAVGITMVMAPAATPSDIGLALLGAVAVALVSLYFAFAGDRVAWPLLIVGGALVVPYVYLRARTPWLSALAGWDALVAVSAGLALAAIEPVLRRASGAPGRPRVVPEPPDEIPFGVTELRVVTAFVVGLAAVAFVTMKGPRDAVGPALATLFFLWRARNGNPAYSVLAGAFINATFVMFLIERGVTSPTTYTLPFFATMAILLHVHRMHLSDRDSAMRVFPPVAAGVICAYEAMTAHGQLLPALALAALGVVLLLVARAWRLRSHAPVGLACIAAALLVTITEWNARGWTAAAVALGAATLLVPALLLRTR